MGFLTSVAPKGLRAIVGVVSWKDPRMSRKPNWEAKNAQNEHLDVPKIGNTLHPLWFL
jgi:hypothetical protein